MTPTKAEIVLALRTELAEQETIAREQIHTWSVGETWEGLTPAEQDQYRRVCLAKQREARFKTVLGHLKALWPEQFETKTTSKKEAKNP